jgi:thyrotropin-releasing hormone receptor
MMARPNFDPAAFAAGDNLDGSVNRFVTSALLQYDDDWQIGDGNVTVSILADMDSFTEAPGRPEPRLVDGSSTALINGYLSTALNLFTLVTNCLVCIVLLKRHMRGSPTNVLLIALSVSTTLTGVWPIPCNVYFYVLGNYVEYVSCRWSIAYDILVDYLPTIFHTSSIWLTVALAVQRYIIVCHAKTSAATQWCTVQNVVRASVSILFAACLPHGIRFFERAHLPVTSPSRINDSVNVSACETRFVDFVAQNENLYFGCYYFFRIVFINCLPCIVLVLLNAALINTMKTAEARRKILLKYNRRSECRRLAESNATTMMLVTVVGVFLLVEFPMAILFVVLIIDNTFYVGMFDETASATATLVVNLLVQFSYLINFFIYCAMSRQFRETFKSLFVPGTQTAMIKNGSEVQSIRDGADQTTTYVLKA